MCSMSTSRTGILELGPAVRCGVSVLDEKGRHNHMQFEKAK